ncbi:MAG: hypothetical protein JWM38_2393 [Sphingomonas bacterium]|nr:hypothetical protein [Sphingomonas bacterium]MDB5683013.1 hypothetical protein [Sphingomonas bacterium]MDB5718966.1 hypothetical protein [Sphingomonas bacterium]
MDLSFGRGWKTTAAASLRLDYPRLVAILASAQGSSRTAEVASQIAIAGDTPVGTVQGLVAVLDPRPGWLVAGRVLSGSFNPEVAVGPP